MFCISFMTTSRWMRFEKTISKNFGWPRDETTKNWVVWCRFGHGLFVLCQVFCQSQTRRQESREKGWIYHFLFISPHFPFILYHRMNINVTLRECFLGLDVRCGIIAKKIVIHQMSSNEQLNFFLTMILPLIQQYL